MKQCSLVIGITGGIATGKTTFSNILREKGYKVLDLDKIGHKVLGRNDVIEEIKRNISGDFIEKGKINRKKLGALVFSNKNYLDILNEITHKRILLELKEAMVSLKSERILFLEIPLYYETEELFKKNNIFMDKIVVVSTSLKEQENRLIFRDCISPKEAKRKIDLQFPLERKEKMGDYIINNSGDYDDLVREAEVFLKEIESDICYD